MLWVGGWNWVVWQSSLYLYRVNNPNDDDNLFITIFMRVKWISLISKQFLNGRIITANDETTSNHRPVRKLLSMHTWIHVVSRCFRKERMWIRFLGVLDYPMSRHEMHHQRRPHHSVNLSTYIIFFRKSFLNYTI